MLTKEKIDRFYEDVTKLKRSLKFPVATIAKETRESKGNVSKYLNKKQDPSGPFLDKFYESFEKVIKNGTTPVEYESNEDLARKNEARLIRIEIALEVLGEKIAEREFAATGAPVSQTLTELEKEIKARYQARRTGDSQK